VYQLSKWSGLKRFYKKTGICDGLGDVYLITLDGKSVKTPAGADLAVPSRSLAEAMATEWAVQVEFIDPGSMPLCKLSATAIDRVNKKRDEVIGITLKIAETDLLCYRATEPLDLVELQKTSWQPELDWAKEILGVDLKITSGILPIIQPESSLLALQKLLCVLDDYRLIGVTNAAAAAGSLVLALSMFNGRMNADMMFEKSILEENYQMEKWGLDDEAIQRHKIIRQDIQSSSYFLTLLEK
jgi:chaperone required for assembly of F1-ATPase